MNYQQKKWKEAIADWERLVSKYPKTEPASRGQYMIARVLEQELGRLEEALERMNPIDREVLVLRHFEELTNSEVAEVLSIQPKAASIRYIRAVGRLKGMLAEMPGFLDESGG